MWSRIMRAGVLCLGLAWAVMACATEREVFNFNTVWIQDQFEEEAEITGIRDQGDTSDNRGSGRLELVEVEIYEKAL